MHQKDWYQSQQKSQGTPCKSEAIKMIMWHRRDSFNMMRIRLIVTCVSGDRPHTPQSSYPTLVGFIGNDPICVVWAGFQNQEGEKENHRVRGGIRREELARNVRCHITPKRDGLCPAPFIVATPLARNGLEVHSWKYVSVSWMQHKFVVQGARFKQPEIRESVWQLDRERDAGGIWAARGEHTYTRTSIHFVW